MNQILVARGHGCFNVAGGVWPLLHMRSFEAVLGPKVDRWLVRTVAGLMAVNGAVQMAAGRSTDQLRQARRIGMGTALTLASIDIVYASQGRISRVYLADAVLEVAWILAWAVSRPPANMPTELTAGERREPASSLASRSTGWRPSGGARTTGRNVSRALLCPALRPASNVAFDLLANRQRRPSTAVERDVSTRRLAVVGMSLCPAQRSVNQLDLGHSSRLCLDILHHWLHHRGF